MDSAEEEALIDLILQSRSSAAIYKKAKSILEGAGGDVVVLKILSALYTRLKTPPKVDLFETYRFCLSYYSMGKTTLPYMERQCDLMDCYEHWNRFEEVVVEGKNILEGIDKLSNNINPKPKEQTLPRHGPNNMNEQAAMLVLKVGMMILRSRHSLSISKKFNYRIVLYFFHQLKPWFGYIIDPVNQEKMQLLFTTYLTGCALSLVEKRELEDTSLVNEFIAETVLMFGNALLYDEMFKFGDDICRSYFSKKDDEYFFQACITESVLESIAGQYKNHAERTLKIFTKLVAFCTINHSASTANHCRRVASFFSNLAAKYFPEVVDVEFCALLLVINDLDSCKIWHESKITEDGMKFSIPFLLTQVELYLTKLTHINLQQTSAISTFSIERLSSMILRNCQEIIRDRQSTTIEIVFSIFIDDVLANCYSGREEHIDRKKIKLVVEVAVASLILSLNTTKQDIERTYAHEKLMIESPFQATALKFLFQDLHTASIALYDALNSWEALPLLKICCEVAWKLVLSFCKRLNSSKCGVSSDLSDLLDDSINTYVATACEDSALYLSILRDCHQADLINSSLESFVKGWIIAQNEFGIMSPVALVKEWVQIQCEQIEGKDQEAWDKVPTIYSLVSSFTESKQCLGIILEQELGVYKEHPNNREFCTLMEMKNEKTLVNIIGGAYRLNRCKNLIECGIHLGICGRNGQISGIHYISEAVEIMMDLEAKKKFSHDILCPLFYRAYCSLALYKRSVYPNSKDFVEDVKNAFKHLSKLNDSKKAITLTEIDIIYFFFVADLLSLEGDMTLHARIYSIMIGIVSSSDKLNGLMDIALQSGNLSHSICACPISDALIKTMSNNSLFDNVLGLENCIKLNSTKVVFEQSLSILPTLSSLDSYDAHATKIDDIIRKVKDTASSLIKSTCKPQDSFVAARLSYDLAQCLIARGLMVEALKHAYEGYRLRKKLLFQCFVITWEKTKKLVIVDGITVEMKGYVNKTFDLHASRVLPSGSYGFKENQHVYPPTPWNLVKCYLESALQIGTIEAMNGNGDKAESILLRGTEVSKLLDLPTFEVGFRTTLGKIYHKKQIWGLALRELEFAQSQLDKKWYSMSCEKCKSVLEVTLKQQLGDLYLSKFKTNSVQADLDDAKRSYLSAKRILDSEKGRNRISSPHERREKDTEFCKTIHISSRSVAGSQANCWHCQPSLTEKSSSMTDIIDMKWECLRRRLLLRLLPRIGKCSRLNGDYKDTSKLLLSSINMLFCRNAFFAPDISISFVQDLVENNVTADMFVLEQASILYKISCTSLKCFYTKREEPILSKPTVMAGLKLASILCSEVPTLYRKVSHLIAVLYARSSIDESFSLSPSTLNAPLASQWSSYFHQAAIGTHVNRRFLEHMVDDHTSALVPRSVKNLESSVLSFFELLPSVSILCISILTDNDKSDNILGDLLPDSPYSTWIMLSSMNSNTGPVIIILPVGVTFTDFPFKKESSVCPWRCPWVNYEMDKLAPVLRCILEEDGKDLLIEGDDMSSMRKKRATLNEIFKNFLGDLENGWFGPWKCLLLGQKSNNNSHDISIAEIKNILKNEFGLDSHESYLRMAIDGDIHNSQEANIMAGLVLSNGCVIGMPDGEILIKDRDLFASITEIIKKAVGKLEKINSICREPMILVPDLDIQMIPWENLPILRQQVVYRMPSVGVTIYSFFKHRCCEGGIPTIDPKKCCYLINPSGEFKKSEMFVQDLCAKLHLRGKFLNKATDDILSFLETLDIFVYLGHGTGSQYIPSKEIWKLRSCAATFLFGCSSGYISFGKTRPPDGAPLNHLLAGSPMVYGNLWIVSGADDHPLIQVLFERWVKAASSRVGECIDINLRKRKLRDEDSDHDEDSDAQEFLCKHKFNLASSIPEAREACTPVEYLMGASAVIYGIPTRIRSEDL